MVMPGDNVALEIELITPVAMDKGFALPPFVKAGHTVERERFPRLSSKAEFRGLARFLLRTCRPKWRVEAKGIGLALAGLV